MTDGKNLAYYKARREMLRGMLEYIPPLEKCGMKMEDMTLRDYRLTWDVSMIFDLLTECETEIHSIENGWIKSIGEPKEEQERS